MLSQLIESGLDNKFDCDRMLILALQQKILIVDVILSIKWLIFTF